MSARAPKRSGSQKRQRVRQWKIAMTEDEHAAAMKKVEASGLSKSSYGRLSLLGNVGARAQRRPRVDEILFGRAVAALNKVGSNLNQIARVLNTYGAGEVAHENGAALAETRAVLAQILALTGRKGRK